MNIRKWVNFVLNPHLKKANDTTASSVHSISCSPEILSEEFLTNPKAAEAKILNILKETNEGYESVQLDLFSDPVVINVYQKNTDRRTLFENKHPNLLPLMGEVQYARMRQYGIYKFGCLVEYETTFGDDKRGLDDIVSDIRAIPTVTIVSVVLANEKISTARYVAGLQIKFIPSFPGSLTQPEEAKAYILRMIKKIKNVKGISRVTLKTDRIE